MMMLFWLLVGHALADFPLQSDFLAKGKNRHTPAFNVPTGQIPQAIWPWCLSAHALIHAGAVAAATGSVVFGMVEGVLHWGIDFAKCENWTEIHTDQLLHVACKIAYVLIIAAHPTVLV